MKSANSLAGKVAIVTGAGDGIGRAVCLRLAMLGATVFGASRRQESLAQTSELLRTAGAKGFIGVPTDVTQEDQVCSLFAQVAKSGQLDILVNNAGAGMPAGLLDITLADWNAQMAVNARGVFLCTREAARQMLPHGSGDIINLSSLAGKHASAGFSAYVASKHAAVGFTEAISRELRRSNVRITSLCPGAVATEMRRKAAPNEDSAKITQPEQIATLIGFILTEGAGMRDMSLDIF
jgi:NAD(P)-dependent dehydrogenase (short-subunit alcohol dehydrogenase family)